MRSISASSISDNARDSPVLRKVAHLCTCLFIALYISSRNLWGVERDTPAISARAINPSEIPAPRRLKLARVWGWSQSARSSDGERALFWPMGVWELRCYLAIKEREVIGLAKNQELSDAGGESSADASGNHPAVFSDLSRLGEVRRAKRLLLIAGSNPAGLAITPQLLEDWAKLGLLTERLLAADSAVDGELGPSNLLLLRAISSPVSEEIAGDELAQFQGPKGDQSSGEIGAPTAQGAEMGQWSELQGVSIPTGARTVKTTQEARDSWGTYRLLNPEIAINPGQAFILRNWYRTKRPGVTLQRRLILPDGWQVGGVFNPSLTFADEGAILDVVNIIPSPNAPAGTYTCQLAHIADGDPSPPINIPIEVKPYFKLLVVGESLPPAISEDQSVKLGFRLENLGNTRIEVAPSWQSNLMGKFAFDPNEISLDPGERTSVNFRAAGLLLPGFQGDWVLNFTFRTAEGIELARADAGCPVFTSSFAKVRSYENTIDTQLQWLYATDGKLQDIVWQWSGSGYINSLRSRKVDFFLQVPGEKYNGTQDPTFKARLSLLGEYWRIDAGDSTYVLSPLTQPGILARGLRLYRSWLNWRLALFGLKERDYTANRDKRGSQFGASALYRAEGADYQLEILEKRRQEITDSTVNTPHQRIYSAQFKTSPRTWGRFLALFGRNAKSRDFPIESEAWSYQLTWQTPFKSKWQGSLLWSEQQAGYWGNTQNRREASLNLTRQTPSLYLALQGFYGRDNPNRKTRTTGLQTQNMALTLRRNLPAQLMGSLAFNYRRKFDPVTRSENDTSNGITTGLNYTGELVSLDGICDIFHAHDKLRGLNRWLSLNPRLSAELQLLSMLRVYWRGSWGATPLQVPFDSATGHTLGLFYNLPSAFDLNFASTFSNSKTQRNQNYSTALNWRPLPNHLVKITYNSNFYPRSNLAKNHTFTLNYTLFFGLPSGRSTGCDLRGKISDEQDPKSSHRYIVCLGGRRGLTSSTGQYVFSNMPAGNYPIWLENLPAGKVITGQSQPTVRLTTGKLETRDLQIAKAGKIRGAIRFARGDSHIVRDDQGRVSLQEVASGPVEGVPGVAITWKEEGSTRRVVALSDSQGRFEFNQLRPGKGIIEVLDAPIPDNYQLDSSASQMMTIQTGCSYDLEWRIVPKTRQIKMLDEKKGDKA